MLRVAFVGKGFGNSNSYSNKTLELFNTREIDLAFVKNTICNFLNF